MIQSLICEKTQEGEVLYDVFSRLVKNRVIFLAQEITIREATNIAATLLYLDQVDNQPIHLYINSPGGDIEALFTIYDMMNTIKSPVYTYCIGEAASAAAVILSSGAIRYAMPNSRMMIHQLQISEMSGTAKEIKDEAKEVEDYNNKMFKALARHTGQTLRKIKEDCSIDYYLNAKEALKYGIIDEIVSFSKELPLLSSGKTKSSSKKSNKKKSKRKQR